MTLRSGIDFSTFDTSIRPQDDLFRHVNGAWLASHTIPDDRAQDGAFRALHDQAEIDVKAIIDEAASGTLTGDPLAATIGILYASFMDEERIEQLGASALAADLDLIAASTNHAELATTLGTLERSGVGGFIGAYVDADPGDPSRYILTAYQSGLGLPDESYYREDEYAPVRETYLAHIAQMLTLAEFPVGDGPGTAHELAALAFGVEKQLARHHWNIVDSRDATKTYNPMGFTQLTALAPSFAWSQWAERAALPSAALEEVVVAQPSFVKGFGSLWEQIPVEQWKAWLAWQTISARAPYLSQAFVDQNFAFYGRTLSGTPQLCERWKRGVSLVEGALGEGVGKIYVDRHFPPRSKERMEKLVANLIEAYRQDIAVLDWMSSETKEKALEKLEQFVPKIGYPAKWRDYSGLELVPDDLLENVRRVTVFETDYELGKIGRPIDPDEWLMTPQTVNAYYHPTRNEIVFPAAILQPPFFDAEADDAVNYGGIGSVIGHEIGHGFDDQGSKYDGKGRLIDWWTDADRTEFDKRTTALIAQYDELTPLQLVGQEPEAHVNGALTVGENIGDLGGLTIALRAYMISLGGTEPEIIDGLSGMQRFFFGWAQVWNGKTRDEEARRRLATDPHSPSEFRCNTVVSNLDEFADVFGLAPGDGLYRDPENRVHIW